MVAAEGWGGGGRAEWGVFPAFSFSFARSRLWRWTVVSVAKQYEWILYH